jgi:hypothetical protein
VLEHGFSACLEQVIPTHFERRSIAPQLTNASANALGA